MSTKTIIAALHEYYALRDAARAAEQAAKDYNVKVLAPLAVECGMDQMDAVSGGTKFWLDGYLVAMGFIPERRNKQFDEMKLAERAK
jgi:hypothetical protein